MTIKSKMIDYNIILDSLYSKEAHSNFGEIVLHYALIISSIYNIRKHYKFHLS